MAESPVETAATGAYGLRLTGIAAVQRLLQNVPESWPTLHVDRTSGVARSSHDTISGERAVILLRNGGEVVIDRNPLRAVFRVPRELGDEELVHPYLAPVAAVVAWWLGRESLHAASFVVDSGAWALLGERESGKSSTLAAIGRAGYDLLADDVLVVDGRTVYAGPRTLDLRLDAARQLDTGAAIGVAGARERWRMNLEPVAHQAELCGLVFLEWGETSELVPLAAADRLQRVAASRALRIPPDPQRLLQLAGVPSWLLRRPRVWESLPQAVESLERLVSSRPVRPARRPGGG